MVRGGTDTATLDPTRAAIAVAPASTQTMQRPLKILSDFDGVWTNQGPEADALDRFVAAELAALSGWALEQVEAELARFSAQMHETPHDHGWAPDGRISAYVDEDPLCRASALCRLLERSNDAKAVTLRGAVTAGGFDCMATFAERCFRAGTASFRKLHPPCIVDGAKAMLQRLLDAGAEVVIVSNSESEKIVGWLRAAGIDASDDASATVRVRGSAAKWQIGGSDEALEVGGRPVYVDRPRYREAIAAENPDLIIGDVFSLDLALPHVMRDAGDPTAPRRLVLRRHPHTPSWVLDDRAGGAIDHVVDQVAELAEIVRALAAGRRENA
jgi:hypothetical protein